MASKKGENKLSVSTNNNGGDNQSANSPKGQSSSNMVGGGGYCLCSPTKHKGSFRCKFHRSNNPPDYSSLFKRSNSMPVASKNFSSISPKSVESST
ncbi:hypothetical protein Leryth_026464 [Lithospermum erythrorhizon]|nr:hypothetical protein Leryth_026464 [Lithospermum erythrorhizon]